MDKYAVRCLLYQAQALSKSLRTLNRDDPPMVSDGLWAWLNVNTRCLYHRIKESISHTDNISLCPLLDFANHSSSPHVMRPADSHKQKAPPGDIPNKYSLSFLSPSDRPIEPDEEIFLRYGDHSNKTLFVEYGFVLEDHKFPEVDIQDIVEKKFLSSPRSILRELLEREAYWGYVFPIDFRLDFFLTGVFQLDPGRFMHLQSPHTLHTV